MKIVFAASSGGHYEQLMMLKPLMEKYESIILTEKTAYSKEDTAIKTFFVSQVNRKEPAFLFKMLAIAFKSLRIYHTEKPDVMITTGVLAIIPMALIMKIHKKKLVYIESFAIINTKTLSGKFLYRFADRFYVQWESMLELYPKAIYKGGIY